MEWVNREGESEGKKGGLPDRVTYIQPPSGVREREREKGGSGGYRKPAETGSKMIR